MASTGLPTNWVGEEAPTPILPIIWPGRPPPSLDPSIEVNGPLTYPLDGNGIIVIFWKPLAQRERGNLASNVFIKKLHLYTTKFLWFQGLPKVFNVNNHFFVMTKLSKLSKPPCCAISTATIKTALFYCLHSSKIIDRRTVTWTRWSHRSRKNPREVDPRSVLISLEWLHHNLVSWNGEKNKV